jgi:hypothetical protein
MSYNLFRDPAGVAADPSRIKDHGAMIPYRFTRLDVSV